jgi:hypothetical protein
MPTTETIEELGWAFCQSLLPVPGTHHRRRCPGYEQVRVPILRDVTTWYFGDFSGGPGATQVDEMMSRLPSHTCEVVRFKDMSDRTCEHCGLDSRAATTQERPVYENLSLRDPDEILQRLDAVDAQRATADAQTEQNTLLERLLEQNAQLLALVLEDRRTNGNGDAHDATSVSSAPAPVPADALGAAEASPEPAAPRARRSAP